MVKYNYSISFLFHINTIYDTIGLSFFIRRVHICTEDTDGMEIA